MNSMQLLEHSTMTRHNWIIAMTCKTPKLQQPHHSPYLVYGTLESEVELSVNCMLSSGSSHAWIELGSLVQPYYIPTDEFIVRIRLRHAVICCCFCKKSNYQKQLRYELLPLKSYEMDISFPLKYFIYDGVIFLTHTHIHFCSSETE